ncbi:MAG: DMT family transporter [Acidobacteriota bacterium]|nr:MAG: DMT family transporter [Acidobacteriota bacterium]
MSAALFWAVSLAMFRGPIGRHGARTINLAKCLLAAVLQGLTVLALGQMDGLLIAPARSIWLIAVSGLVGLTLGDTALFASVARIGVHRALLLQTLAPVFTAIIAALWLGERTTGLQAVGAVLILSGVALVVAPRREVPLSMPADSSGGTAPVALNPGPRSWALAGSLLGVVAAFGQGCGLVLAKVGMEQMPVLPASFLRLTTAALGLAIVGLAAGRLASLGRLARTRHAYTRVVPATLLGTYLALFLMMAGIALAPASIAAVLLSMSPVFSLVLETVVDRRPLTVRGVGGTFLALAGVAVLTGV